MADVASTIKLRFEMDKKSVADAVAQTKQLAGEALKAGKAISLEEGRAVALNRAVNTELASLEKNLKAVEAEARRADANVKKFGGGLRNVGQLAAALGILSDSAIGQAVTTVVTFGDALKSLGGVKGAVAVLPAIVGSIGALTAVAGVAIGGLALAFGELSKEAEKARKEGEAYAAALIAQSKAFADTRIALSRGDTESVLRRLKQVQEERLSLLVQQQRQEEDLNRLTAQRESLFVPQLGILNTFVRSINTQIQGLDGAIRPLEQSIPNLQKEIFSTALVQQELTDQLLAYGFTVEEIEQAIADLDKATDSTKQGISELTKELLRQTDLNRARVIQEADLLAQNEQALKARADALRLEQRANEQAIEALRASGDTSDEVTQKIKDYEQANIELSKTLDFIASSAIPNAINRARDEARKLDVETTRQDTINATKKFNSDVKRLNEQGAQELFNIEKKRTDGLLQIAERYASDTIRALTKLNDDLERNRSRFTESEFQARQKGFFAELDATKNHLRAIEDIRTKAQADEIDALGNLDFKRAFEIRRGINRELAENQKKFTREAQDREEAQDRDRQERLRQYAQAQADAQANYQKELAIARDNRAKALAELQERSRAELVEQQRAQEERIRVLQEGYREELRLAQLTALQRVALQRQADMMLLAQSRAFLSASAFRPSVGGSSPSASPRPTSQTGAGRTTTNNTPQNVTVNINGAGNPRQVAQQVLQITQGGKSVI